MTDKEDHEQMNCPPPPRTLADLRRAAGMTQAAVAERLGVHPTRVGFIEARYPNVQHAKLMQYIEAIGGQVCFTGISNIGGITTNSLITDPALSGTRAHLDKASRKGAAQQTARYHASRKSAAEELPLQGDQPEPGGDDPSREVDQPDPESDQTDGTHGQQP